MHYSYVVPPLGVAVALRRGVLPVDAPPTTRGGWSLNEGVDAPPTAPGGVSEGDVSFKAEWELKVEVDRPGKDDVK